MKQYDKYKDSGISWLGEIPEHWETRKIKFVFTERSQKGYPNEQILCSTQSYGVIPQSMYENRVVVVNKGFENLKLVCVGDFVISLRSFQGGIEYAYYRGIISAAYTIIRLIDNSLSQEYVKLLFKSHAFIQLLKTCVVGIREGQNINYSILKNKFISIPPISEQHAMVEYVSQKCKKIDKYIQNKEKEITALDELKQSIIAETVTKGLDKNVAMKDSDIAWIGKVPEHWKIKRSAMLFQENKKKNSTLEYERAMKFNYGTLVDKNETGEIKELEDTYKNYTILDKNDIVINCLNLNYDFVSQRVAISPKRGIITSAYLVLRPRKNTNAHYYNYLLKAMDSMKLFHGMGTGIRLTLSFDEFKKQLLPIPPLSEQEVIVAYINSKCEKIDKMKSSIESQITALKEYKQRLISDVVTGKKKVTPEN